MAEEVKAEATAAAVADQVKAQEASKDDTLEKAREIERNRFTREESLRRELEDKNRKLESIKKQGWDLDLLTKKSAPELTSAETDYKKEIQTLKEEMEKEKSRRAEIEELQSILDFTNKNSKYELINNLDDAPKYIQMAIRDHYRNTGKHLSYEEACDFIEDEIEKAEIGRFEKFSKTKKAEKIYKLNNKSADQEKPALSSKPTSKVTKATATLDLPEPKDLHSSNSKEAFNYFLTKHGYKTKA